MNIEWNRVTWYSKLAAVVLFVFVAILSFYFGARYGSISTRNNFFNNQVPNNNPETKTIIQETILDFSQAVTIRRSGPTVQPYVVSYAQKEAVKVRGVEIPSLENSTITILGQTSQGQIAVPVRIVSVGKYTASDSYPGIVWPSCSRSSCGYTYGGGGPNEDQLQIIFEVDNQSTKAVSIDLRKMSLLSRQGEITRSYTTFDTQPISVQAFGKSFFTMGFLAPDAVQKFFLSYESSQNIENLP